MYRRRRRVVVAASPSPRRRRASQVRHRPDGYEVAKRLAECHRGARARAFPVLRAVPRAARARVRRRQAAPRVVSDRGRGSYPRGGRDLLGRGGGASAAPRLRRTCRGQFPHVTCPRGNRLDAASSPTTCTPGRRRVAAIPSPAVRVPGRQSPDDLHSRPPFRDRSSNAGRWRSASRSKSDSCSSVTSAAAAAPASTIQPS